MAQVLEYIKWIFIYLINWEWIKKTIEGLINFHHKVSPRETSSSDIYLALVDGYFFKFHYKATIAIGRQFKSFTSKHISQDSWTKSDIDFFRKKWSFSLIHEIVMPNETPKLSGTTKT